VAIPTNGSKDSKGNAVMGAGLAKAFRDEIPNLPIWLGRRLRLFGNVPQIFPQSRIITIPVKHEWEKPASLELMLRSLAYLDNIMEHDRNHYGARINHVYVPRLGCGNGGLDWKVVEPIIKRWLGNSSLFTVVSLPDEWERDYGGLPGQVEGDNAARRRSRNLDVDF
jgi:hypothetical protein